MIAFVVPLDSDTRRGQGARAPAWRYVLRKLIEYRWPVATGVPPGDLWVKADAVDDALARTSAEIVIVHDADVVVAPIALHAAMQAVEAGAPWAVPHRDVHRYDQASTHAMYDGERRTPALLRWPYIGVAGGGIVVLHRDVYAECPLDPRFIGWGGEDQAWGWALETLFGEPWRGTVQLVHLWHPHAAPGAQRPPRRESERLRRAYRAARGDADSMRRIVTSARATA